MLVNSGRKTALSFFQIKQLQKIIHQSLNGKLAPVEELTLTQNELTELLLQRVGRELSRTTDEMTRNEANIFLASSTWPYNSPHLQHGRH